MDSFSGVVHRITYQNHENGYCVLKVKPTQQSQGHLFDKEHDSEKTITVTGNLTMLREGDQVDFSGEWKNHPKYGSFLDVQKFYQHAPSSTAGLKRFLATSRFKGVGEKTAEILVEKFGEDLIDVIENRPDKLAKLKGITTEKATEIQQAWFDSESDRNSMIELQGIGLTPNLSQKLIDQYGSQAVKKVKENPYQLAQEVWGVGFSRADEIGNQIGFGLDHPHRIQSGIQYALQKALDNGHLYLPQNELLEQAQDLLKLDQVKIDAEISSLLESGHIILDTKVAKDAIYLSNYHKIEKEIARGLLNLLQDKSESSIDFQLADFDRLIDDVERDQGFELGMEQKIAVQTALTRRVTVMTGGPGTGKSTTLNAVVKLLKQSGNTIALTAPTGRAAKRMSEISGVSAQTLHRLLKLRPGEMPEFCKGNYLPYDMVVVDEASMLDVHLMHYLVNAIGPGTHLLLVGDADQLPSVQAGNVLADIISSHKFPVAELQTIFRQARESAIIQNAHRIRKGLFPILPDHPTDFYFSIKDDINEAADEVITLVTERIPKEFGLDPKKDVQVLAPLYKTAAGVGELNRRLQEALNPKKRFGKTINMGYQSFRVGDRVMQLRNNYEKEVFNGDVGIVDRIQEVKDNGQKVQGMVVSFPEVDSRRLVEYEGDEMRDLTLAYAVSVHKSQGSEYPAVIMPVLTSHYIMLQRNLVYTGITRAKKLVILVGQKKALFIALNNDKPQQRYSGLKERLVSSK